MPSSTGRDPERKREAYRRWRRENPEKIAEYRRRYAQEHAEHIAELNRAWRETNLDRSRELNRLSARRQAKRRRQRQARNARARERYPKIRDAALDRARRFRQEHPEKVREYQRRYKERHPERARLNAAAASQRYRDAHAEDLRERQRLAAAEHRRANPDAFKDWYAGNREAQRARGRESARAKARLKALGLPARRIQFTYATERRANEKAADEFFQRRRSLDERARIAIEAVGVDALEIPLTVDRRRRQFLRVKPTMSAKERIRRATLRGEHRRRTAEVAAELKQEQVKERRASDLARIKRGHEAARQKILESRPEIYEYHRRRREAQIREEVRMDSVARQYRGLPAYHVGSETAERMDAEVAGVIRTRLEALKERTLSKVDRVLERHNSASPLRTAAGKGANGPRL